MACIVWNLEQLDITQEQADKLLKNEMIYDPRTGDEFDCGEGIYYPSDDYTLDDIKTFLTL